MKKSRSNNDAMTYALLCKDNVWKAIKQTVFDAIHFKLDKIEYVAIGLYVVLLSIFLYIHDFDVFSILVSVFFAFLMFVALAYRRYEVVGYEIGKRN